MSFEIETPISSETEQRFLCKSPDDTRELAKSLAKALRPGDVLALHGALGAGKTTLIKMVANALGYEGIVSSPTFTLLNIYNTKTVPLYHFDFYRINSEEEAFGFGAEEYIDGDGIAFIEWPERAPGLLPESYYDIHISIPDFSGSPTVREITIIANSK